MTRTARFWRGVGPLAVGGVLLSSALAVAAAPPPLSQQLTELGRQARAQGETAQARKFFHKAVQLDPANAEARRALSETPGVRRVVLQDPAPPAPDEKAAPDEMPAEGKPVADAKPVDPPPLPNPIADDARPVADRPASATIDNEKQMAEVRRQQLTTDIADRLKQARDLVARGSPEAALNTLRLAQDIIRGDDQIDEPTRRALDRRIQAQVLSTARDEERIVADRAEKVRLESATEQQQRAIDLSMRRQDITNTLMIQFDALMNQGQYNILYVGGTGNITEATQPFVDARLLAQKARAQNMDEVTPWVGVSVAQTRGFLAQELAFEALKEYRFMLTMQDVARAAVPFPDTQTIEYPDADTWRRLSEKRIERYGRAVDLLDRDAKTKAIIAKLEEPVSMAFANETPLEDVLKYIKQATTTPNDTGIPIYVDPIGLQEAEKTMQSPVQLDLEGVPLKTTLRLLLKQLGLTYTVKSGMLTITSESSNDTPTEIRVYPVADLAIIPMSLMGGGGGGRGGMGGGGMGGGMGGGGMGGGGMGGGGMGGGGMGGMGGMMSVPPQDPRTLPGAAGGYMEKKRS